MSPPHPHPSTSLRASPLPQEGVLECHSEALAEESRFSNLLKLLDSSLRSEWQLCVFKGRDTVSRGRGKVENPARGVNRVVHTRGG
jgi:hypothetical protein